MDLFPRKVVRKNYGNYITQFNKFPNFVAEFLISKYADSDGSLSNEALEEIIDKLKKMSPEKRDKEAIKAAIMDLGGMDLIDHYEVYCDLRNKKYYTYVNSLDERALVNKNLVKPTGQKNLLRGGLWGRAKIKYIEGERARLNIVDFESFQMQGVILSRYIENRKEFSLDEWLNFLIRSIGLSPNNMTHREKLLIITRLIPFVESGVNLLELGPPGTGKSFIYENSSTYSRMLLGGDITPARLIYNQNTRQNGLVFTKDVLCFDEINKSSPNLVAIIPKLQQIMASDKVERGDLEAKTEVSLVFQGNIDFKLEDGKIVPKEEDYLKILPSKMHDSAFLDRIHLFIHGWNIPRISDCHINYQLGLISNHLAEIFHKLRRESFLQLIDDKIEFFKIDINDDKKPISIRDKKALYVILSGFIKLLYPHQKITDSEWIEILELAIELRQNVINEIIKIDPTLYRRLAYRFSQSSQLSKTITEEQAIIEEPEERKKMEIEDQYSQYLLDFNNIFVNKNNLITKKLPIWTLNLLINEDKIKVFDSSYKLLENDLSGFNIIKDNAHPILITKQDLNLENIDSIINKIENKLTRLKEKVEKYNQNLTKLHYYRYKSLQFDSNNEINRLANKLERKLNHFPLFDRNFLRIVNELIVAEKEKIQKLRGSSIGILIEDYLDIVEDFKISSNKLNKQLIRWSCLNSLFKVKFNDLFKRLNENFKNLEKSAVEKEVKIFGGKKFPLFAIDVNNLFISFKNKFQYVYRTMETPIEKIKKKYLDNNEPYLAYFFASYYLKRILNILPENDYNHVHIESMIKNPLTGEYLDVDVYLAIVTTSILDTYRDQINHFYLCSADKDFYLLIQKAQNYGIPVTLVISDEKTISEELEIMVNYKVEILY